MLEGHKPGDLLMTKQQNPHVAAMEEAMEEEMEGLDGQSLCSLCHLQSVPEGRPVFVVVDSLLVPTELVAKMLASLIDVVS